MHIYSTGQWVLLFFFYCFCGWVWESCYVSLCQRRWVNRGFLHGPLLPIYGFGAILILFVTLPVENDLRLVWLLGMLAATALEYVVGAAMERLFQVRYWDYSKHRFNLHGYICLSSSIAWGFFSILLVRFVHPPVGRLLADVPSWVVDPLALALTAAFTVDVVRSVQAALDLREMLVKLTEENEDLRRLARRAEIIAAFAEDDLRRFRERTEVDTLQERIQAGLREAQAARRSRRQERIEAAFRRRTSAKLEALSAIAETLEHLSLIHISMGEEDLIPKRSELLSPYRVTEETLKATGNPEVLYMHCLPSFHDFETKLAKEWHDKGVDIREVTDEVFRGRHSVVFDEAENRMHTIKAVMVATIGK